MSKKQEIEGALFLSVTTKFALDPAEQMIPYVGQILLDTEEGEYAVGVVKYYVARVFEMLDSGVDPVWELDGLDVDTADYCEFFNEDRDGWSEAVLGVWPEAEFGDLVILNRLVVNPPFRGKDLGLQCLGVLMRIISGATLFVMRPMPLQYVAGYIKSPDVAKVPGDKAADVRKLMAYYAKAGFREIPGTGQMVFDGHMMSPLDKKKDFGGEVSFKKTTAMEAYRLRKAESKKEDWL